MIIEVTVSSNKEKVLIGIDSCLIQTSKNSRTIGKTSIQLPMQSNWLTVEESVEEIKQQIISGGIK